VTEAFPPTARSARSQNGRRLVRSATAVASSGLLVGMGAAAAAPAVAAEATDCLPGNTVTSTNNPADIVAIQALLDANTAIVCLSGTFVLANPLTFDHNLELFGIAPATLDGNNVTRMLTGSAGAELTVQNLSFIDGSAIEGGAIAVDGALIVENSSFTDNSSVENGGAIHTSGSSEINVVDSTFTGNSTGIGGYAGGAIFVDNTQPVFITDSAFSNNEASEAGGAVAAYAVLVERSTFDENTAPEGGAVVAFVALSGESTFSANTASSSSGGAVSAIGYAASFGSTFVDNSAAEAGGAIASGLFGEDLGYGAVIILNSTFVDNTADVVGGAIIAEYGQIGLSTFLDNEAGSADPAEHSEAVFVDVNEEEAMELAGNIFAGSRANAQLGASDPAYVDNGGNVFSTSESSEAALSAPAASTLFDRSVASLFGPSPELADNGGETETLALIGTSPAIDAVPASALVGLGFASAPALAPAQGLLSSAAEFIAVVETVDVDQRNVDRTGLVDAGAYEYGDPELAATGADESTTTLLAGFAALLLGIGASFAIGTRRLPRHTR